MSCATTGWEDEEERVVAYPRKWQWGKWRESSAFVCCTENGERAKCQQQ
jgi:hypothetical protein